MLVTECDNVVINNNLVEANDRTGIMVEYLHKGNNKVNVSNNIVQYNNGFGVEMYAATNSKSENNTCVGNGNEKAQEKITNAKYIIIK